jgi:hypothetical protein
MPFLGVSSLDLGRFTKVTPAFFLELFPTLPPAAAVA